MFRRGTLPMGFGTKALLTTTRVISVVAPSAQPLKMSSCYPTPTWGSFHQLRWCHSSNTETSPGPTSGSGVVSSSSIISLGELKTTTFLQRVLALKDQQLALDMVTAAVKLGTLRDHHVDWIVRTAMPRGLGGRVDADVVSGKRLATALLAEQRDGVNVEGSIDVVEEDRLHRQYYLDGGAATSSGGNHRYWERAVKLLEAIVEEVKAVDPMEERTATTSALLLGEERHNQILAYLLAHCDIPEVGADFSTKDVSVEGVREVAAASWRFAANMELSGFYITNAKSLELLQQVLGAFDAKETNPESSASIYTSRKEFLEKQEQKLTKVALAGGRLGARRSIQPRVELETK